MPSSTRAAPTPAPGFWPTSTAPASSGASPHSARPARSPNPLRFGVDLVRRVYLEGTGLSDVALDFVPLLAVAALTLPLAGWLFRNRLS
jgi:ABC-2 type transport system permease protein